MEVDGDERATEMGAEKSASDGEVTAFIDPLSKFLNENIAEPKSSSSSAGIYLKHFYYKN